MCVYVRGTEKERERELMSVCVCVSWNGVEEPGRETGLRVESRGLGLRVEVESRGTANA